jgi:hypothetical protein
MGARMARKPGRIVEAFADHLNTVLNATVSRSRVSLIRDRTVAVKSHEVV